jgi:glyoxylase-like metal-dependent hydrolase (beta-lactamase superfamily II)
LDRDNRLLFVGDTFYLAPLYTHLDGSDFDQYAQSAARLAQLAERVDSVMTAHNVPVVASRFLVELDAAFTAIREGGREYVLTDGFREYDFGEFSVIVRDAD